MERNKRLKIIIIILLCIIIILLIRSCNATVADPVAPPSSGVVLNIDENAKELEEPEPPKNVSVPGWGSITLPPETSYIDVDFYNPIDNADNFYLTFELKLADEVLYSSDLVEPGKHIKHANLSHGLEAGTYDAVLRVQPYTMDEDMTPTNNVDIKVKLYVK